LSLGAKAPANAYERIIIMAVLVTGGAGYIGSHTAVELLNCGKEIVVMDNLSNSKQEALDRVKKITGKDFKFYKADILDREATDRIFEENDIDSVIHFAGLKAVGESVEQPLMYYRNNVCGTVTLLESMAAHGVVKMIFSSSATVYGAPKTVPIKEDFPLAAVNPYGSTKLQIESILQDLSVADKRFSIVSLRYFNPIGAHESGLIGEDPKGIPNNLLPYVSKVACGKLECLSVFGNDYPTPDGTGVRDYIHVVDLAKAHIAALEYADKHSGMEYFNVGTGTGYSVLEIVSAYQKASGKKVNYKITARRPGDVAECYADPSKAERLLGWKAEYDLERMCRDCDRWQTNNPDGYK